MLVSSDGCPDESMKIDYFFERVPLQEMRAIYSSCDVLVKLSAVEGVFGPPLEMMACGGTAITSDVLGHEEFMKHGINGFVCKNGDIRTVRQHVKHLIEDRDLLARLKKGGICTAEQFDWSPTLKAVEGWMLDKLRKGTNVLMLKVVNERQDWSACARFTDKNGKPLHNLKVTLTP